MDELRVLTNEETTQYIVIKIGVEQFGIDITYEYFYNWFSDYVVEQYSQHILLKNTAYNFLEKMHNMGFGHYFDSRCFYLCF